MLPLGTSAVTIGLGMLITFDTPPVRLASTLVARTPRARVGGGALRRARTALGPPHDPPGPARGGRDAWERRRSERGGRSMGAPFVARCLAGAGFSAAISLGEFGATTILTRSGSETLPIAIGRLLGRAGALPRAQAFAMATILLVLSTVIVMASGTHEHLGSDDA